MGVTFAPHLNRVGGADLLHGDLAELLPDVRLKGTALVEDRVALAHALDHRDRLRLALDVRDEVIEEPIRERGAHHRRISQLSVYALCMPPRA